MSARKKQFLSGMRAGVPVILGFIPVGIAYAIMARQAGFTIMETCSMSLLVFAGASQMMVAGMYAQGANVILMIIATFLLNLRHIIMSVCIMTDLKKENTGIKLLSSFGVTDESFAIFTTEKKENKTIYFFIGLILVNYLSWNVGTLLGAVLSDFIPEIISASLGISLYAMFIGLLVPNLRNNFKLLLLVCISAIVNSVLSVFIDSSISLIISSIFCAFVGVFFVEIKEEKLND